MEVMGVPESQESPTEVPWKPHGSLIEFHGMLTERWPHGIPMKTRSTMEGPWESHGKHHRSSMRVLSPHGRAMRVGARESTMKIPWGPDGRSMAVPQDDAFRRKFHGSPWGHYNSMGVYGSTMEVPLDSQGNPTGSYESPMKGPWKDNGNPTKVPWKHRQSPMEVP